MDSLPARELPLRWARGGWGGFAVADRFRAGGTLSRGRSGGGGIEATVYTPLPPTPYPQAYSGQVAAKPPPLRHRRPPLVGVRAPGGGGSPERLLHPVGGMVRSGGFRTAVARAQRQWDGIKVELKRRVTGFDPLALKTYRGHGGNGRIRLTGRLIEDKGVEPPDDNRTVLRTALNNLRRFESDEIPDARVIARFGDTSLAEGRTDHEGFFHLVLDTDDGPDPGWVSVEVELLQSLAGGAGITSTAEVLVPDESAEFGIISDIDDTVLETTATDLLRQLRLTFSHTARSRSPMLGARSLYRALERGPDGKGPIPFFYVSKSGWGLYDLIEGFMDEHDLPKGPIYLQDIAVLEPKSPNIGSERHKHTTIRQLFDDYPDLGFVLIGDSGQDDPETYLDMVKEHPARVRAVLIRSITRTKRDVEVHRIVHEMAELGIQAAAAESSTSLARAAADFGLIPHETIDEVRQGMVEEGEEKED